MAYYMVSEYKIKFKNTDIDYIPVFRKVPAHDEAQKWDILKSRNKILHCGRRSHQNYNALFWDFGKKSFYLENTGN